MMKLRFLMFFLAFLFTSLVSIGKGSSRILEKNTYTLNKKSELPNSQKKSNSIMFAFEEEEEDNETSIRKAPNQMLEEDGLSHHHEIIDFTLQYRYEFPRVEQKVTTTPHPSPFTPPDFLILNL